MSIRIAASCGHDLHESVLPRGARTSRALTLAMIVRPGTGPRGSGGLRGRAGLAQELADPLEQLRDLEWLDDVLVGPDVHPLRPAGPEPQGGQQDDLDPSRALIRTQAAG